MAMSSRNCTKAYILRVQQAMPQIDTARAKKSPFQTEINYILDMHQLKIGSRIDIVFANEIEKANAHYMKAVVYDYESKDKIIISQTSPRLNRHFLNRKIIVTFLANYEKRILRFGFAAHLTDLLTNYELSSNKNVEALVIKQIEDPVLMDFRMHFRVKPPSQSNITLFFQEKKVNLIDISLGGAKFTYPKTYLFHSGEDITFKLTIDSTAFEIHARVRSVTIPNQLSTHKSIQHVSVKFDYENKHLNTLLSKAILSIERQLLSEGKIN
ncbi:MAG: PilZ domain-containing protein [Smithella sp.]